MTSSLDIFIDMTALIGQDYSLTRAFRLVIMRPEWLATEKDQCVKQIQHLGQNNRCTISYRLIGKGVKVEEGILNRQTLRKEFEEMALDLQNELKCQVIEVFDDEA